MLNNFLQWRRSFGTDEILGYSFPEVHEIKRHYPHGYHKVDKIGRPIYIERIGQLDIQRVFEITTEDRMMHYYVREYERLILERFPAATEAAGYRVEQSLTILDLQGISMKMATKQVYNFIKIASSIAQDYYPEMLGKMFIINAPFLFKTVWGTIKKFIDEKTRNKISILDSNYGSELLELADADAIPDFLTGGTCHCPQGCLNSGIGPWNPDGHTIDEFGAVKLPKAVLQTKATVPPTDLELNIVNHSNT
jgi:hypothetical protein